MEKLIPGIPSFKHNKTSGKMKLGVEISRKHNYHAKDYYWMDLERYVSYFIRDFFYSSENICRKQKTQGVELMSLPASEE